MLACWSTLLLSPVEAQKQAYHHFELSLDITCSCATTTIRSTIRETKPEAEPDTPAALEASYDTVLKALKRQMEDILGEVEEALQQPLQEAAQSIPGIGTKTTATAGRVWFGGSQLLDQRWESFAGLDVIEWKSGTSVRKKPRSKQGNWKFAELYFAYGSESGSRLLSAPATSSHACANSFKSVLKNQTPFRAKFCLTSKTGNPTVNHRLHQFLLNRQGRQREPHLTSFPIRLRAVLTGIGFVS